ncbi:MAG: sugar ABC transporter permease [Candidatus Abyssobacteria bacterium SURF_5]|uniref:Sugar ABC transporter permease n=1 Tax=Abyssobacteria bacterium (strain SURF_5) TaxID=2093360 RepID=A0A3A4N514_ABYX5|nr:MAG: sugar ABC transporter permease [Candidatus Abyssubacteria bacterium SURF_5]
MITARLRKMHPDFPFLFTIVLPALLMCAFVFLYPAVLAVRASIFSRSGLSFNHYSHLLSDNLFFRSLLRTFLFAGISVSIEFVLGFVIAILLAAELRGRSFFRAALLIPWVLPPAVMGFAWRWIFYEEYGIVNDLLTRLDIIETTIPFLADPRWAFGTLVFADVWKTAPFVGIILLAGLTVIPRDLYEAAAVDGAGVIRRFFLVTLPMLAPYILTALLFRLVHTLGIFDLVWVLTGGGPSSSTEMVSLYITKETFAFLNIGYGAALSVTMFAIVLLIAATVSFLSMRRF